MISFLTVGQTKHSTSDSYFARFTWWNINIQIIDAYESSIYSYPNLLIILFMCNAMYNAYTQVVYVCLYVVA